MPCAAPLRTHQPKTMMTTTALVMLLLMLTRAHDTRASRPPPNKLIGVKTNCTRDVLNVKLELAKPFRGVIFARDFLDECRTNGNQTGTVVMSMPTAGCGIRSEHRGDGTYELSVMLVMQLDNKLRQMSDIKQVVRCILPDAMMSIDVIQRKAIGPVGAVASGTAKGEGGRRTTGVAATSGLR